MNNETETTTMDPNDPKRWTQRQRQRKWTSSRFSNDKKETETGVANNDEGNRA